MQPWDPDDYLRFGDERTRPSFDLAARIAVQRPERVIDLGCGPGNSTRVLRGRWPDLRVVGLDSSEEMIATARETEPDETWVLSAIEEWSPDAPCDVVFTSAAIQWLPDHELLVGRLFEQVAEGGALAIQIPAGDFARVFTLTEEVAAAGPWASRMVGVRDTLTMEDPSFYYDVLAPRSRATDIWETEYYHVLESPTAAVDWISGTGLRPYFEALDSEDEKREFVAELNDRAKDSYPVRPDGRVLFPFKRVFVIAYR